MTHQSCGYNRSHHTSIYNSLGQDMSFMNQHMISIKLVLTSSISGKLSTSTKTSRTELSRRLTSSIAKLTFGRLLMLPQFWLCKHYWRIYPFFLWLPLADYLKLSLQYLREYLHSDLSMRSSKSLLCLRSCQRNMSPIYVDIAIWSSESGWLQVCSNNFHHSIMHTYHRLTIICLILRFKNNHLLLWSGLRGS